MRRRSSRLALAMMFATLALFGFGSPASADDSHALITGSGSTWSSIAVNTWISDVQASGLKVVFTGNGSATGRTDFALKTTDFAVSDIGYLGRDPVTGEDDNSQGRQFAYLPIVAGGTSFAYHVERAGKLVRNIRLKGLTLAKIFTNQITDWSDPAITADNNGVQLPALPIIPIVHSEGSGSTAQFTAYLASQFPSLWTAFNNGDPTSTEYYPRKGNAIGQSGSDGVMNYVASSAANGAISFDEYSYALAKNYPVIKLENPAGYYTAPTQYNVAVALTAAKINMDKTSPNYLLQDLSNVYTNPDPRAYSLSSYSYMLIPTAANDATMTTPKRQTLADYLYYGICPGQAEVGPIGYSALPLNLVQASFDQIGLLKTADPGVNITARDATTCNNPTFDRTNPSKNLLAEIDPAPPACDQDGQGPCADGVVAVVPAGAAATTAAGGSKAVTKKTIGRTTKSGAGKTTAATGGASGDIPVGAPATDAAGAGGLVAVKGSAVSAAPIDPGTGQPVTTTTSDGSTSGGGGTPEPSALTSTKLPDSPASSLTGVLAPVAVVLLLTAIMLPAYLAARWRPSEGPDQ